MTDQGPLAGLRVLDLTGDLGRFATKLLAEYGADVVRVVGDGSAGKALPGVAGERGGLLDHWFDASKTPVALDLDTDDGCGSYRRLAANAELIVESRPVGYLAERAIDHSDLVAGNPRIAQVSITPFGRTGPRADWQTSDLVAGAMGGVLSLTGLPDEPLNSWGWQNYNFGGFAAALSALAAVRSARLTGRGQLVDLSLHEVLVGSIENLFMQYFYDEELELLPKVAVRQGALHWLGLYDVVPTRSGAMMISPTPQPESLIDWMVASGVEEAEPFLGIEVPELLGRIPEVMAAIRTFATTGDAAELWWEAQKRHIAFGEVQGPAQVAANPQFAHRGLFSDVEVGEDETLRRPWRLVRYSDTPQGAPGGLPAGPVEVDEVDKRWAGGASAASEESVAEIGAAPLDGLVVVDLSWVLAGPFSTRLLGDLGADVVKVQTEERATLVNHPEFPYYPVWNRSKRSVTLNFAHPDAVGVVRRLIESADVLVENFSAGVLDRLGLGWEAVREWNDQLVYISMSGCGHDGPWSEVISYAPTIHALCGLTHLTNPPGRGDVGCGFSLNDHAAGFAAAYSVLAGVEARNRTGRGQHIDLAQLEVGAFLIGPALIEHFATGTEPAAAGNVDGLVDVVPNEVYRCADGRFLAVSATSDAMWAQLAPIVGLDAVALSTGEARRAARGQVDEAVGRWAGALDGADAMVKLQGAGVAAGVVQDAADLAEVDEQLAARRYWLTADLTNFGPRRHDRYPALWSDSSLEPYRPAPAYLGEANFDVWTDLCGLTFDEVADGIASGLFV